MKKRVFKFIFIGLFILPLLSTLFGCEELKTTLGLSKKTARPIKPTITSSQAQGPVVARINDMVIGQEEFEQEIEAYNLQPDVIKDPELKIDTVEEKEKYLDGMIDRRLLYHEASIRGLDNDRDIKEALERFRMALLIAKITEEETRDLEVSEQEIKDFYEREVKGNYGEAESRQVREILFSTKEEAAAAYIELLQGADFATIATNRSKAASQKKAGDLGPITYGSRGQEFEFFDNVVFSPALKEGEISNIFQGPQGFYIIKVEKINAGKPLDLSAELSERIKLGLQTDKEEKKIQAIIVKLRAGPGIKIEKVLENIK